jgi:hypothetical protein
VVLLSDEVEVAVAVHGSQNGLFGVTSIPTGFPTPGMSRSATP